MPSLTAQRFQKLTVFRTTHTFGAAPNWERRRT